MPTCICIFSVLSHFSMHPSLLIWVFTIYYVFQVHFFERNCFRTQESKTSVLWLCERSSLAHEENTDTFQDLYWIISFGPTSQQCYSSSIFAFACGCLIHCSSVLRDRNQGQGDNFSFCGTFLCPNQVELRRAVEEAVKETPEYRCMQSQFSVLYNESLQLKAHLDEARTLLHGTRATHQRQVELIEVTPLLPQPGSSVVRPAITAGSVCLCRCSGSRCLWQSFRHWWYPILMKWEIFQVQSTEFCFLSVP